MTAPYRGMYVKSTNTNLPGKLTYTQSLFYAAIERPSAQLESVDGMQTERAADTSSGCLPFLGIIQFFSQTFSTDT